MLGLKLSDNFHFRVVQQEEVRSQTSCKTKNRIVYILHSATPGYSLTVIDTPGLADEIGGVEKTCIYSKTFKLYFEKLKVEFMVCVELD